MFGIGEMVRPVSPDTDDEQYLPAPLLPTILADISDHLGEAE
jgi:hypothetical protein